MSYHPQPYWLFNRDKTIAVSEGGFAVRINDSWDFSYLLIGVGRELRETIEMEGWPDDD